MKMKEYYTNVKPDMHAPSNVEGEEQNQQYEIMGKLCHG